MQVSRTLDPATIGWTHASKGTWTHRAASLKSLFSLFEASLTSPKMCQSIIAAIDKLTQHLARLWEVVYRVTASRPQ